MRIHTKGPVVALLIGTIFVSGAGRSQAQEPKKEAKADPAAFTMLQEAHDKRENFPAGFTGLTANLTVSDETGEVKGSITYSSKGELTVSLASGSTEQQKWAKDQLGSAFGHRQADDFSHGDGANPLTFVSDDHSPLGKQIALNDKYNSMYRVSGGHITQVTRSMGPTIRFTITVTGDRNLPNGKYLPAQFTVTYFDATSGAIKRLDMFTDSFRKLGDAWVPSTRRVITAENGKFSTRMLQLDEIKSLDISAAAK